MATLSCTLLVDDDDTTSEPQREAEVVRYAWGSCPSARRAPCFAAFREE